MLVRKSMKNLFGNEGFQNEDTDDLGAQFCNADHACAKVVPTERDRTVHSITT